ncbi:hypothetical protein V2H45_04865 [Tumidithrix elongata RA019]|uniref:Uncharacterized protein n=1 Tax=Tumidithrix elongata BACA0141 TaxID=2716417 RepID=A0AAW9PQW3_9CYAN|nr:hypothetical protein [Tumidithrix elongata RA019]
MSVKISVTIVKKIALVLLASPMFLTFMLLGNSSAHAGQLSSQIDPASDTSIVITRSVDPSTSQANEQNTLLYSDRVGDLAIAKLGCDCAGCRNVVIQMVGQGKLRLPQ